MIKHKAHHSGSLNLNWQSTLSIGTRVVVGIDAITKLTDILMQIDAGKNILLLHQSKLFAEQIDHIRNSLHAKDVSLHNLEISDGEECKSVNELIKIWGVLYELKFSRQDTIIAFGGGTVSDIGGFAASTYLRGINLVVIPTTLLAQVDAAIGGKTGINFNSGKNLIGNYCFAKAIIVDTNTLACLPKKQFVSGLAEIIKYSFLEKTIASETEYLQGPRSLLSILLDNAPDLSWDNELLSGIIIACIKMKLAIVATDPQEKALRRCLNLGHTLGHALESVSKFDLSHGEAVAIGMAFAFQMAVLRGQIGEADKHRALGLIEAAGLPTTIPKGLKVEALLDSMFLDKKREGEGIKMVLPRNDLGIVEYKELIKKSDIEITLAKFNRQESLNP